METREVCLGKRFCIYLKGRGLLPGRVTREGLNKWYIELTKIEADELKELARRLLENEDPLVWDEPRTGTWTAYKNRMLTSAGGAWRTLDTRVKFPEHKPTQLEEELTTLQEEIDATMAGYIPKATSTDLATLATIRFFSIVVQGYLRGDRKSLKKVSENVKRITGNTLTT